MRYYAGMCEYKWSHSKTDMEKLWVRRELGDDLFKTVESNGWEWILLRSNSQTLPGDIYCRCDIFVEVPDSKEGILFYLKYSKLKPVEKA